MSQLQQILQGMLDERQEHKLLRHRRIVRAIDAVHVEIDNKRYVNFASNNYLGLTHHPALVNAIKAELSKSGAGSGAAGLITGHSAAHASAERAIAQWKQMESAVLLPSGYQANLAVIQTLGAANRDGGVRFLIDKLAHASLVDAVRAADAPFRVFPHNHLAKLSRLLEEAEANQLQVVLTESIFSMDGDAADLAGLVELKKRWPFALVLDEAHTSGVYGADGNGYASEVGLQQHVDVSVVTLSKALGCAGGAVCASSQFCQALINFGRGYIYSTNMAPMLAAAAEAAIEVCRSEPARRDRIREIAKQFRAALIERGLKIPEGDSPIIPVILGDEQTALDASALLADEGLLCVAVRPPTVPRGASRLRITLSSEHSDEEINQLLLALSKLKLT